ncbi:pectin lyase fold/virulence factor [Russula earlei]|uniref:Pectin lyase fold/virulence factor n=1 Tax=Russula earlei TaxID=71964 RepID=A0ACC0TT30_9AGAM|nr:pectin lyase fold/virulence factor [Russula earlei]
MKGKFTKTAIWVILFSGIFSVTYAHKKQAPNPPPPTILYVDALGVTPGDGSSWAHALRSLDSAFVRAWQYPVDSILVAQGTYYPSLVPPGINNNTIFDNYSFFLPPNAKVCGGYNGSTGARDIVAYPTILNGTYPDYSAVCPHVILAVGNLGNAALDGLTITQGYAFGIRQENDATIDGLSFSRSQGGGLAVVGTSGLNVTNCIFSNNSTNVGGAICVTGGSLYLANCTFTNNLAYQGGAINISPGSVFITNCLFTGNNTPATDGGLAYGEVGRGGAINNIGDLYVFNCTIADNVSTLGAGIYNLGNAYVHNSILWNNDILQGPNTLDIQYNIVQGAVGGSNNIDQDPLFNPDYTLQKCSPAINSGDNASVSGTNTIDLAGNQRIYGIAADMGAYEWQSPGGPKHITLNSSICQGSHYAFIGQNLTVAGTYIDTIQTYYGCDSIITLNLTINPPFTSSTTINACSAYTWNGNTYTSSGVYTWQGSTAGGCDSIATLHLTIVQPTSSITNIAAIASYTWNGNTYTSSGSYVWHGTNAAGCDSTATLNLAIYNNSTCIYVDSSVVSSGTGNSWASPFKTFSEAFTAANIPGSPVDSILVAKGTYYPTGAQSGTDRAASFVIRQSGAIKLYGGYATGGGTRNIKVYPTILSGDIGTANDNGDNSLHVMVIAGQPVTADSTIIDGFSIRDGNANDATGNNLTINGQLLWNYLAGSIYVVNSYHVNPPIVIRNCSIINNSAVMGGALVTEMGSPVISNCVFSNNTSFTGGAIWNDASSPLITNCTFSGNSGDPYYLGYAYGGAIYNTIATPIITNCVFLNNTVMDDGVWDGPIYGGGIANDQYSLPVITNCVFSGNISRDRLGGYQGYGAAIANINGGSAVISNCTFWNNVADYGAGIYFDGNAYIPSVITNCIVYGNSNNDGVQDDYGAASVTYSIVQGGYPGTGNINTDPLFLNTANIAGADGIWGTADDGLRVQPGSIAVNGGNPDTTGLGIGGYY